MSSVRNFRARLLTATAAAAVATLSLTACSDGSGARAEGPAGSSSTASADSGSSTPNDVHPTTDGSRDSDGSAAKTPVSAKNPTVGPGSDGARDAKGVTCQGSNTKTVAAPLERPVNHLLLTVTNTGSSTCHLYGYPALRFGEAQSVPPAIEASHPQAVVTLAPGESGYASVSLSATDGSGTNGRTEESLTVFFQGRTADEDVPSAARPSLPAGGVAIDDSLKVTYWQQSLEDAIAW
ncbi:MULTISPECIES: DUF4232 domain-containing protein [Streptomyces]|uniref:DUF4232 domain-containing protein n=1 Tax=Streptomyces lycii TaxID=2654337 RepID=A0ABQ7FDM5_9ACTN|nr:MULTISPECIES: DUF4232 domain-containing protein [Streptomyces]KAF4406499.1 DUF4232 domain-containing protein [Streptomyces lycii]PGH50070.1 hypothetical protein CRI70_14125 [Streptomyces sp. Ru87]